MGQALTQVRQLLTVNDCSDRVLERYYLLDPCKDIAALGYTGAVGLSAEYREKVTQMNVSYRQHDWENYLFNASVMACVRTYVFGAAPAVPASHRVPGQHRFRIVKRKSAPKPRSPLMRAARIYWRLPVSLDLLELVGPCGAIVHFRTHFSA